MDDGRWMMDDGRGMMLTLMLMMKMMMMVAMMMTMMTMMVDERPQGPRFGLGRKQRGSSCGRGATSSQDPWRRGRGRRVRTLSLKVLNPTVERTAPTNLKQHFAPVCNITSHYITLC